MTELYPNDIITLTDAGSSTEPYGISASKETYANNGWDSLDGDLQLFLAI
jgi:hypothetical protein